MARFLQSIGAVAVGAVSLVQHPAACWAADTTGQGVTASVYAGGGHVEEPNNESSPDEFDEYRAGLGAVGIVRFKGARDGVAELGGFALLAASFELERLRQTACSFGCDRQQSEPGYHSERHFAGRVNVGYGFRLVELRVGALAALPDSDARLAEPLLMPEVAMRLGRRSVGWFELGLGAYDASTNFRPGVYVGGAYGPDDVVRVSGHFGVHLPNGLCCSTVAFLGFRSELGLERALTDELRVGLGAAAYNADVFEGSARLSFLL